MTAPSPPTTAALVARYADDTAAALLDGRHGVASPLGAWAVLTPSSSDVDAVPVTASFGAAAVRTVNDDSPNTG